MDVDDATANTGSTSVVAALVVVVVVLGPSTVDDVDREPRVVTADAGAGDVAPGVCGFGAAVVDVAVGVALGTG